jgi:DNA polymerase III delta prime subunit
MGLLLMNNKEFLWVEKYRPTTIDECILPEALKNTFKTYVEKKEIPNIILHGGPGTGKTTTLLALCEEIGCDHIFINGSSENGIDVFRNKITNYASAVSLSGGRKAVIIDESDYMNSQSLQPALRSGIEEFSQTTSFLMTCNFPNKIIGPIHSRCAVFDFKIPKEEKRGLMNQFYKRVCSILTAEGVEYNKEVIVSLITKYFPDYRKILNELQRYSVNGNIDVGILTQIGNLQLKDLIDSLKDKNYAKVREWVNNNFDNDIESVYRKIYDGLVEFLKPTSIPTAVLIIAKYQYQSSFVADPSIQLLAFFTEMMIEVEFK